MDKLKYSLVNRSVGHISAIFPLKCENSAGPVAKQASCHMYECMVNGAGHVLNQSVDYPLWGNLCEPLRLQCELDKDCICSV